MIFVTLGSQKFQFDRLLMEIDRLIEEHIITDEVFAQTGESTYVPKHFGSEKFVNQSDFAENMSRADLVITHAGTGAIINAVKRNKKVIAVPRLKEFHEHVDDHQIQIVRQFADMNYIEPCYQVNQLKEALALAEKRSYALYQPNTERYLEDISNYILGLSIRRRKH